MHNLQVIIYFILELSHRNKINLNPYMAQWSYLKSS